MSKPKTHDDYIAAAPAPFQSMLGDLRRQLAQALPDADETMMYDLPGFSIAGTVIAGYAAFSKQCGLYVDAGVIADHADEIAAQKLKATKTGVTFSPSKPISDDLVSTLAIASRQRKGL